MSELTYDFRGKVCRCGASSGSGRPITIDIVSRGWCVLVLARRKEKLKEIKLR